jgi:hypothetical protein
MPRESSVKPMHIRCDSHVHIVGPADIYPQSPTRTYLAQAAPLDELLALAVPRGIERFVIVQPSFYGADNTVLLESLDALGGRGRGVAVVDHDTIAKATLATYAARGVGGLRLNLYSPMGNVDRARMAATFAACCRCNRWTFWRFMWATPGGAPAAISRASGNRGGAMPHAGRQRGGAESMTAVPPMLLDEALWRGVGSKEQLREWRQAMLAWTCEQLDRKNYRVPLAAGVDAAYQLVDRGRARRLEADVRAARALFPHLPVAVPKRERGQYRRRLGAHAKIEKEIARWALPAVRDIWAEHLPRQNRESGDTLAAEIVASWMSRLLGAKFTFEDVLSLRKKSGRRPR